MIITKRHVSRRTVLKGVGVSLALPFLDAMAPAATALAKTDASGKLRFIALEMVHGAAGSTAYGAQHNLWSPGAVGAGFDLGPTALAPLEPLRDYITIVSNTDVRMAEAFTTPEIGGDHFRASSVFLTQAHPKQTMGSDLYVGTSFDQIYARQFGQDTAIPSMQLCIESVDHAGGCEYNYSCAYTDAISWASPSEPLPMLRDPRAVFDTTGFHNASHHNERPERILDFAKINKYHISLVPYFLERLKRTPDGDGNLLDHSLLVYGSPMGNPNVHNHKRCPLFLAGKASGQIKAGLHVKAPDGTPMANVFLTLAHMLGIDDMASFGDSTGELDVNATADLSAE